MKDVIGCYRTENEELILTLVEKQVGFVLSGKSI